MQIQCPECGKTMSVGAIKPGRYQPKCKQCGKPFGVVVTADDPAKIQVGKIHSAAPNVTSSAPAASSSPSPTPASPVAATLDSATSAGSSKAVRRPMPAASPSAVEATSAANAEATMDQGATTPGAVDATRQHLAGSVRRGGSRAAGSTDLSANASAMPAVASSSALDVPERLGGYRILRLLGRGAMGAVYEAKQISLGRNVALKTIRGRLADNPSAIARFMREAYAAAQLVHHNVVQIYDFGQDAGQHYFSMEWVRGGPLSDLIRDHGPVDPRVAATYVLQAARGLEFAHRHGMVHRDVKPANLLLNDEGVVKVADLGLVKVPDQLDPEWDVDAVSAGSGLASGTQVTMMGTAVGTPAYMAPEQSIDATTVDHRADIYSLGCSLFYLLAGKAPFDGSQVSEVMRQHAQSPVPKIRSINRQVPEPLSGIIERSMAKRPEDRYASLADMIAALENYLGLQPEQGFSPSHQQADRWEELAAAFAAVPLAKLTRPAILGLVAFAMLLLLVTPLLGMRLLLTGPALLFTAFAVAWGLSGSGGRSIVATRLRHWLGSLSWFDYAVGFVVSLMTLLVSFLLGMIPGLVIGVVLGAAAGAGYHFLLALPLRQARNPIAADAAKFVRDLRIAGIDEENIRDFAARYSGTAWRPLFEELFGYDAMLAMRAKLASDPAVTSNAGDRTLRDWICASLQAKTDANRTARAHQRLATLEEQGLKSEGMTAAEAKERAWQMASAMMDAAKLRPLPLAVANDPKVEADQRRTRMKTMLAEARSGKYAKKRDRLAPLRLLLGGKVRLLIGCGLLAWFGLWAYRNDVFTAESLRQMSEIRDIDELRNQVQQQIATATKNTDLPKLLGTSGWAVGIAGLLMAGSSFISGWRMSLFAVPAVMVAIFGESFGIPAVAGIPAWAIASAVALVLMIPGLLWGESRRADY